MTAARPVFATRTVFWMIAAGASAFAAAMVLLIYGDAFRTDNTVGANAFSRSAIGHLALVRTLRRLEVPVILSRNDSAGKSAGRAILLILEPGRTALGDGSLNRLLQADRILLALPKRFGPPDPRNRRWLGRSRMIDVGTAQDVLASLVGDGSVLRPGARPRWLEADGWPMPSLDAPQLMRSSRLRPVIESDQGMLVGAFTEGDRRILVLSDPDILANHGLGDGENALLAVRLIDWLGAPERPVIIDETAHGFRLEPSLWRTIFEFPYLAVTVLAFAAVAVLMWAATGRFGAPQPLDRPFEPGRTTLIESTGALMREGGYDPDLARHYFGSVVRDVSAMMHAPAELEGDALVAWLDRVGSARGTRSRLADLGRALEAALASDKVDARRLTRVTRQLHAWKQEMKHGS
ncbi:MAG: hypothetical protein QNJ94_13180 [Alphaproteobacteria bacterium]|nr:hypothetical protein [Alphaproteobacteria bacterium]